MSETRSLSLRDYVQHKGECDFVRARFWGLADARCTCGLDDALRSQEPVQAQSPCYCCVQDRQFRKGHPAFCEPGCRCWGRCDDPTCCEPVGDTPVSAERST